MSSKSYKPIGDDHPIVIEPSRTRVLVRAGGRVIANTTAALTLKEAGYPPVLYIPRADVDMSLMERTEHGTHCPFKGDASYYSVREGGTKAVNAAWSYETPFDQVAAIAGHLAFYPDRIDSIDQAEVR